MDNRKTLVGKGVLKMEKKKEVDVKKIILVCVVILLLGGIIFCLTSNTSKNKKENNNADYLKIDEETKKLYTYIPCLDSNWVRVNAYQTKKVTLDDFENSYLLAYAAANLELSLSDKELIAGMEEDDSWYRYDATLLQNKVKEMYGKTLNNELYEVGYGTSCNYEEDSNKYNCSQDGGSIESMTSYKEISKFYKDGDNYYIEDKYLVHININDKDYLYGDSNQKVLIAEFEMPDTYLESELEDKISEYNSKMVTYKHTFKMDEEGNYYWYSSEPLSE